MPSAEPLSSSESADLVRAMEKSVPQLTISSTVAIVGAKAPIVRQIGSGTLIAVADSHFILTAAHVIHEGAKLGYTLAVSGDRHAKFTALGGTWMVSDTTHDIALYQLSKEQVPRLGDVEFARIGDASFVSDLSNGYFVVSGFPGMWSTVLDGAEEQMRSKLLQYGTWAYAGSVAALDGYDATKHFLLTASPSEVLDAHGKPVSFRTRQGFPAQMPADLRGVSGCSVWMIGDLTQPAANWDKRSSRIVGVETGVFPSRGAIKVTRWNAVTTLLYQAFPPLRPAIEMYVE